MYEPRLSINKLKRNEIKRLFEKGERVQIKNTKLYYLGNGLSISRFAILTPKKLGNAVYRNRVKRYFREAFRINQYKIKSHSDILILVSPDIKNTNFVTAEEILINLLNKAGIFINEKNCIRFD
ncbi:MAG: ribonuclease P protein component [Candidatus Hydrogenedentota bacterium]